MANMYSAVTYVVFFGGAFVESNRAGGVWVQPLARNLL
jgi:hypothetical protein